MSHTYRVGIVGTGGIAHAHGRACRHLADVDLRAVCDVNQEAVRRYGDQFNVERRYTSLDAMLDAEDLDIVIVSTWGHSHAEVSNAVARSHKARAILCEKPLCRNAAEAQEMIMIARKHGVLLAEAFKFRHHPQHLRAKEIVDSGRLGDLQVIRSTFSGFTPPEYRKPENNWRFNRGVGGGVIYDMGCYNIHHARFITGAEPVRVFATGSIGSASQVDESVAAVLEFPGDIIAQFTLSFRASGSQSAEVYGTRGCLRFDMAWNNENHPVSFRLSYGDGSAETHELAPVDQFVLQLRHLCDCLETGHPHRIPPENSLNQMRVIDALYESMSTGRPVSLMTQGTDHRPPITDH
ncbi:MAG: Gfo/Idh/MocA family oxidoreductase [Candidatus Latescibacteria bacterium]|nr:Gfo/Idh/MocA family oxidoreductase [Candidatus Latescibacterota bacterium]